MKTRVEKRVADRTLSIETGELAKQADGAVVVQYGDSVVLVAAVAVPDRRNVPFFPMTVEYREKQYAAGQIPGSIFRREGRPTTKEILTCRLIDRPTRPLFPKGYHKDVQIMAWVLSADGENDPDLLAMIGASTALSVSDIPWEGPTGACRVGLVDDEFIINPVHVQRDVSELNMVVSSTADAIIMVEGWASTIPEEDLLTAIQCAHDVNLGIVSLINELVEKCGRPKQEWEPHVVVDVALELVQPAYYGKFVQAYGIRGKREQAEAVQAVRQEAL
ncbi:MAG: polyribonucleotide nucleotidyltransferase, partial [Planctomycetota bacterium]